MFTCYQRTMISLCIQVLVVLPAILKSQANAISSPPPNAKPSIAASIGTGRSENDDVSARKFATILGTSLSGMLARSFRSAPTK